MPEKPHENSSQWRLTALNFFLFFFFILVLVSLSCCPHCQFIFTLFLRKLTSSSLVRSDSSQEQGPAVCSCQEAASIPSACTKASAAVSHTEPWQLPPHLCFTGKCLYFPPAAFWKAGHHQAEASSALLYIFVLPKSNFV